MEPMQKTYLFDTKDQFCSYKVGKALIDLITHTEKKYEQIAFICIGTDRSTGDCFGPLVGHQLSRYPLYSFEVFGTLQHTVHALNLSETLEKINTEKVLLIAVDSSLGSLAHIGYLSLGTGKLKPGAGVGKDLPPVGDIYISGIVNISGFLPTIVLQSTSLCLVHQMAETTVNAIKYMYYQTFYKKPVSITLTDKTKKLE